MGWSASNDTRQVRLVSVLSGKGGVGKSIIAFNLAERAAAAGQKILLVDADLCCGNLHILANVTPRAGLEAYAAGDCSLADAVASFNENLDILSRLETGPLEQLDSVTGIARWVKQIRDDSAAYDLIILDHGSGISDTITVLANASDANLLVLIPELTSLSDCYGLCKYLYQANPQIDCRLLINRIDADSETEYIWTKFAAMAEQFLGQVPSLAGSLPEDPTVRKSVGSQRPIAEISNEAPVVQALNELLRNLNGEAAPVSFSNSITTINNEPASADTRE
jgi:flagellar biosynthesis protein FlhG